MSLGLTSAEKLARARADLRMGRAVMLTRAADVHLKERRPLVLLVRESPLHLGHLRSMAAVTEMGAIIAPPVPAFYWRPQSVEEMVDVMARRAIDHLGLEFAPLRYTKSHRAAPITANAEPLAIVGSQPARSIMRPMSGASRLGRLPPRLSTPDALMVFSPVE